MYEIGEEEVQAVSKVIRSGQLFRYSNPGTGECARFESEVRAKFGCAYALAVNSGTSALVCSLVACDIGPGDEVIVPAFTFMATALAVLAAGAVPVLAEIDETLTLDPADVERKITPRTRAIVAVHMLGRPCAMDALLDVAGRHGLRLIEDACQAVGASYHGHWAGTLGDVGCLSFNQFKIISAGEGGAVLTNQQACYEKAVIQHDDGCAFRQHAQQISVPIFTGGNYRISEVTGAILRAQLARLDGILERLRERKRTFDEALSGSQAFELAPENCPKGQSGMVSVLQLESEDHMRRLVAALQHRGIQANAPFDSPGHVYTGWKPVLDQLGAHHPGRNAYCLTGARYEYTRQSCPVSLNILSRTMVISINLKERVEGVRRRAETVRRIAESL